MLQLVFESQMGRNERPPRIGVNLIDVFAQVSPVQFLQLRSCLRPATPQCLLYARVV
jgi:hypothetical protein